MGPRRLSSITRSTFSRRATTRSISRPAPAHERLQVVEGGALGPGVDGELGARDLGGEVVLGLAQAHEHEPHQGSRSHRLRVGAGAHRHPDGGHHPDGGRAGEPGDGAPQVQDGARADEADPGQHLGRDAAGVAPPGGDVLREHGEEGGPDADEDVGAQAGGLAAQLAFEADGPAQEHGEDELEQELQPEVVGHRVDDIGQGVTGM